MEGYAPYVDPNAVMRAGDPGLDPAIRAQELGIRMDEERRQRAAQEKHYQQEQLLRQQEKTVSATTTDVHKKAWKYDPKRMTDGALFVQGAGQTFYELRPHGTAGEYLLEVGPRVADYAALATDIVGVGETVENVGKEYEKDTPYLNMNSLGNTVRNRAFYDDKEQPLPLENGAGIQRVYDNYGNILKDRKEAVRYIDGKALDKFVSDNAKGLFPTEKENPRYMRGNTEFTVPVSYAKGIEYFDSNTGKIRTHTDPTNERLMHPNAFDSLVAQPGMQHMIWKAEPNVTAGMAQWAQTGTPEQKAEAARYEALSPDDRDRYVAMGVWDNVGQVGRGVGKESLSEAQKLMDDRRKEAKQDTKDAFSQRMQVANFNATNAERAYQHQKDQEDKTGYTEAGAGLVASMMGNFGIDPAAHGLPKATLPLVKMPISRPLSAQEQKAMQYMGFGGKKSTTANVRMFIMGDYFKKPADIEGYAGGGTPAKSRSLLAFAPATGDMVLYNAPNVKSEDGGSFSAPVQQGIPINLYTGDENDLAQAKTLLINQGIYVGLGTAAATRKAEDVMNGILFTKQEYQRQRTQKTSPTKTTTK